MKYIQNITRFTPFSVLMAAVLLTCFGCTKDFESLNTNPTGVTNEQANADYALIASFMAQAQRDIIPGDVGEYQLVNNLASDAWGGYLAAQNNFAGNANNLTYNLVEGWYQSTWNDRYIRAMNPLYRVMAFTRGNEALQDVYAFALVVRVSAMHRTTDKVGPIIYTQYNRPNASGGIDYDSQEAVYDQFFLDLDTAQTILSGLVGKPVSAAMSKTDLAYKSDNYAKWLRYANTLRLRIAMRIAYVNPAKAKEQGEKAMNPQQGGLLEDNADNCFITLSGNHPLNTISSPSDWSDTRMGAPMESYLKGYSDPRLPKYFLPAKDPAVKGQYKGIRSGINIDGKGRYNEYSELVTQPNKMQIMVAAESWFLKAEAALRGWAGAGDAQANYETGITKSFEQYALQSQLAAYMNDATSTPAEYIDPKAITPGENDIKTGSPYLSTITIMWDQGATPARKLERILTQKWLAIYPDGDEAWAEYRRTGYPILYPVVVNFSNDVIPSIPGIRRVPFPQREYNSNSAAVAAGVGLLGGPDNGATRLWWDVADKSF